MGMHEKISPEASEELKKIGTEVNSALDQLRKAVDTKNAETLSNVEKWFKTYEDENQKLVKAHALAAKQAEDVAAEVKKLEGELADAKKDTAGYKERVEKIEMLIATGATGNKDTDAALQRKSPEYENFFKFFRGKEQDKHTIDL